MPQFFTNAVKWLSGKTNLSDIRVASITGARLHSSLNDKLGLMKTKVWPINLEDDDYDIYLYDAKKYIIDKGVNLTLDFVKKGKGLLIGGQAWSWRSNDPDINRINGFPGNK